MIISFVIFVSFVPGQILCATEVRYKYGTKASLASNEVLAQAKNGSKRRVLNLSGMQTTCCFSWL